MDVFQIYKPFRNKIRQLSYDDSFYVTWAYSQYLQIKKFQMPNDIKVHKDFSTQNPPQAWISEWELELIAKEVIINGQPVSTKMKTLRSWSCLSSITNQLRDLENDVYRLYGSSDNVLIELTRIAHRQFIWQGNPPNAVATIRYFKIFNRPTINQICQDRLGLSVEDIYLCGTSFMGMLLSRPAIQIPFSSEIALLTERKVRKFLSFTSRTLPELRRILCAEQQFDDKFAYAYSSLRAFPLVRMRFRNHNAIVCPLPTLLFWRITGGLYYELLKDARFAQEFGSSFQTYVGDVIRRASQKGRIKIHEEREYGTRKARKDSVDWILSDDISAVFLECKARRLTWSAKSSLDNAEPLEVEIDGLADAIVQVYKTISDYMRGEYLHFPYNAGRKIFPLVVTLENWHIFGPWMLDRLRDAVDARLSSAGLPPDISGKMPYSVCSISDLEVGAQIMNRVGLYDFFDTKINDAEMGQWDWKAYMTHRVPENFTAKNLFRVEYEKLFSRLVG